jgi:hypothetical protein
VDIILTDYPGIQFHRYISEIILILMNLHATCLPHRSFIAVITRCSANFGTAADSLLGRANGDSPTIRNLFTNYDIITDFANMAFCSEHFISIKHRILATFNIKKIQF